MKLLFDPHWRITSEHARVPYVFSCQFHLKAGGLSPVYTLALKPEHISLPIEIEVDDDVDLEFGPVLIEVSEGTGEISLQRPGRQRVAVIRDPDAENSTRAPKG